MMSVELRTLQSCKVGVGWTHESGKREDAGKERGRWRGQAEQTTSPPTPHPIHPVPSPWAPGQCGVPPLTHSVPCGNVHQPQ